MKTTDYLDAVKEAYGLTSDYQLSKKLGVTQSRITSYRSKRTFMDDSMALKIAYLLDAEPLRVLASIHAEREERQGNDVMVNFWNDVAKSGKARYVNLSRAAVI